MVENLLEEAVRKGFITCPHCDNRIEPDADACYCGWLNPLVKNGWI
jgi:phage terminase large subunit GpA-like protein